MTTGIQIICILAAAIACAVIIDGIVKFLDARRRIRQQLEDIRTRHSHRESLQWLIDASEDCPARRELQRELRELSNIWEI